MNRILNKQDVSQAKDIVIEEHPVAEWGGSVYVRSLSAAERGLIENDAAQYKESKGKGSFARTFTVKMALLGMCDADGKRMFDDNEIGLLQEKNALAISAVAEHVQRLSGFSKADLEELEKNSVEAQPAASVSG